VLPARQGRCQKVTVSLEDLGHFSGSIRRDLGRLAGIWIIFR
jgi:hypothetical protein